LHHFDHRLRHCPFFPLHFPPHLHHPSETSSMWPIWCPRAVLSINSITL
jgi:hypothetical protein